MQTREMISTGNQLAAVAAVDAGCKYFAGYPLTPSSEIMHTLSDLLPQTGGVSMQMEDEIASICSVIGASMSGKRAMTATSGPGLSLKAENLGLAHMAEVPLVCIDVMRGGPSTGLPTRVAQGDVSQVKHPSHGDLKSITVSPGNLLECYTEVARAFNLADRFMQPVFVIMDETLGHMHGKAMIPLEEQTKSEIKLRKQFEGKPEEYFPYGVAKDQPAVLNTMFKGYRYHFTGLHHDKQGFPTENMDTCTLLMERLFNKVEQHEDELEAYEEYMLEDAEVLIIAYGSVSLSVKEAIRHLRSENIKVGLFRPITLWPSPANKIKEYTDKIEKVLCIELNMGQYFHEIQRVSSRLDIDGLFKVNGRAISPHEIIEKVKGL